MFVEHLVGSRKDEGWMGGEYKRGEVGFMEGSSGEVIDTLHSTGKDIAVTLSDVQFYLIGR